MVLVSSQTIQCALVSVVALGTTLGSSYWRDINKALVYREHCHTTPHNTSSQWKLGFGHGGYF